MLVGVGFSSYIPLNAHGLSWEHIQNIECEVPKQIECSYLNYIA